MRRRAIFLSVVPSPYQRDVFAAIAHRGRLDLQVHYLERSAPDSPWPSEELSPWESILPGLTLGRRQWRSHLNWRLPVPARGEVWVVNGAMTDVTTQLMLRRLGRTTPWCFWGELPSSPATAWRRWLQARQYAPLQSARAIIAVGQRAMRAYRQLAPGVRVLNQPYACGLDAFATAAAHRPANLEPVFLFCGQMIERKGIDVLLEAFDRLVREGVPARLELIGREAGLPTLLAPLGEATRRRITYRGFLAPGELPARFGSADAFVLPSRHDGWGVVINQAFGAGLPVISTDAVGAAHDLIATDVNGLLVPASDATALAGAMRRLALSADLRKSLGAAAAATAAQLTPERAAVFWEELTENL